MNVYRLVLRLLITLIVVYSEEVHGYGKFEIAYQWNYVNFTWPSIEIMETLNYSPG